jgi:cytochrome b561
MTDTARPARRYTRIAMLLHWLVALLIVINVVLIWSVDLIPEDSIRFVIDTHKSTGITVLGLVLLRILWRIAHPPPPLPAAYPVWEKRGAHFAHLILYALILALPLSGWMHDSAWKAAAEVPMQWFGLFEWPRIGAIMTMEPAAKLSFHAISGAVHVWLSYALYILFALHVGGALKHQFIDREPELERMLPGKGASS